MATEERYEEPLPSFRGDLRAEILYLPICEEIATCPKHRVESSCQAAEPFHTCFPPLGRGLRYLRSLGRRLLHSDRVHSGNFVCWLPSEDELAANPVFRISGKTRICCARIIHCSASQGTIGGRAILSKHGSGLILHESDFARLIAGVGFSPQDARRSKRAGENTEPQ